MNLNQITIQSRDVMRSMIFYQKLGLLLIVDAAPRYVRFECPTGNSTFSINHSDQVMQSFNVIYFEVTDVDAVYQQLLRAGIKTLTKPQDQHWLWREIKLSDPDGHQLKIYSAGHNRKNPPWRKPNKKWYDFMLESPYNLMK